MTLRVDVDEVQANVLYGYGAAYDHALYVRLKVERPADARAALGGWLDSGVVTFSNGRKRAVTTHVNVAFTHAGLDALGLPDEFLEAFPEDFRRGGRGRAAEVHDSWPTLDDGRPEKERYKDCHVLVSISGGSPEACAKRRDDLRLEAGFEPVAERRAALAEWEHDPSESEYRREHFGFADGRSQPAVEGVDLDAVGDGVYAGMHPRSDRLRRRMALAAETFGLRVRDREWRLIKPGEFLLGYENEDGELPHGPPAPLGPNGTFMVYREIDQHPGVFTRYVDKAAETHRVDSEELAAKIVGRWRDGTPVARVPEEEEEIASNRRRANDFRYEDDPYGFGCPLGAHVRRANPRDALPGGAERTMRHRIIRRGMPYGPRNGDGSGTGLAFICFSASIANGFEFIQREWLNSGDVFGLGNQPDFLLQQQGADGKLTGKLVIPGYRPIVLDPPDEPFVVVRGCEYLFVPSRQALTWMSRLAAPS